MLIIDTGVLVAAADRTDPMHDSSAQLLRSHAGPLITNALVIAEAAYLIERELGPRVEALLYESIIDGSLLIEHLTLDDWARVRELVVQYADLRLGGTDASLVALAERFAVSQIATLNHRHFAVVRPRHTDAFEILPGN